MTTDHIPLSLAHRCVRRVLEFRDIDEWAELCLDAVLREGAGPMIEAARLYMPLGHHPEVRTVMRRAADSRIECLKLLRRI
ncbi:hypothetical protein [Rhodoferax sp.]|uniref:hypothetical protein n=1 Tax=Rhodoferax sp. TaxID=50421 RepID=UPI0025D6893F|nr:hypothetical protein [Rhodoferax sp.]